MRLRCVPMGQSFPAAYNRVMDKALLILNPESGDGAEIDMVRAWVADRPEVTLRETTHAGSAKLFTSEGYREGFRTFIAAGGDGTVHEVLNGLAGLFDECRLGIIPMGTGNDFARTAMLPLETAEALLVLDKEFVRRVDVIRIENGRREYLLNSATGGLSARVRRKLRREEKRLLGPFAYLLAFARSMRRIPWYRLDLKVDGETIRAYGFTVLIGNGKFIAGGHPVVPEALLDDGKMDLSIITAASFRDKVALTILYFLRLHQRSRYTVFRQAADVEIDSRPPMAFIVDGEEIGKTPMHLVVQKRVLQLLSPPVVEPVDAPAAGLERNFEGVLLKR